MAAALPLLTPDDLILWFSVVGVVCFGLFALPWKIKKPRKESRMKDNAFWFVLLVAIIGFLLWDKVRPIVRGNPITSPAVVVVTQIVPVQQQGQEVNVFPLPTVPASVPVNVMAEPTWTPFYQASEYIAPTVEMQRGGFQAPTQQQGTVGNHVPGRSDHRSTSVP